MENENALWEKVFQNKRICLRVIFLCIVSDSTSYEKSHDISLSYS